MLWSYGYRCSNEACGKKKWELLLKGTENMHIEICECGKRMDLALGKDNCHRERINDKED